VRVVVDVMLTYSMPARIGNESEVATSLGNWSEHPSHVIIAESEQLHTLIGRKYRYFYLLYLNTI
jgi:hypothetical protein